MLGRKKIISYLFILLILTSFFIQIVRLNLNYSSINRENQENIHNSASVTNTLQWITNGNFTSADNWTSTKGVLGDPTDVGASINGGVANYEIIGHTGKKETILNETTYTNWAAFNKTDNPLVPNNGYEVDSDGVNVSHLYDDNDADQTPIMYWRTNVSMGFDMSDYLITSASLDAIMNASVYNDIDVENDTYCIPDDNSLLNQRASYDYAQFFVEVADMEVTDLNTYELAFNQTKTLGEEYTSNYDIEGPIETKNEQAIIDSLTNVLAVDPGHDNFTLILGIYIYSADNWQSRDEDSWLALQIKNVNLTFTYEKKIDQLTSISWDQDGEKPSDLSVNPIVVDEALLNFKYMINESWPVTSPNSEIRFYINNYKHTESVKLSIATGSFQLAKVGGFDVTSLIDVDSNVNFSIELYLADDFTLNRSITISIDNVSLIISYTETFADTPSNLDLFLDMSNKTLDLFIEVPLGEMLNVTVMYTVNQTGAHITNATVQLEGKVTGPLNESITLQQYTIMVDTSQLGVGVKILSVSAQKDVYEPQSIQFFVEVVERDTEIQLFIDSNQKNDGDTIELEIIESINVTVNFRDNLTQTHLSNATVNLVGRGVLNETNNQYNITLNAIDLGQGITVLTVFAQLVNYQSQSIQFYVNVIERTTEIQLILEDTPRNDGDTIQLEYGGTLNVTINFRDNFTKTHLPSATVDLVGFNSLNETNNQYNITVTSQDLGLGISALTVLAQLTNYQTQSIQFFVEVYEKATEIQLIVEDTPRNDGDTIQLEYGGSLNVTVNFRDNTTKNHLSSAILSLVGFGALNETNNQYNITLSSQDLGLGISALTVLAQLSNYQTQSIQFFVEVYDKATEIQLIVEDTPRNEGDTIRLEYGGSLNVTINFLDNTTKTHLPSALVNLVGFGTLDEINNQYNITITSQDLGVGTSALTILAQLTNYSSQSIQFFVEVIERSTELQLFVEGNPTNDGETIQLEIDEVLNVTVNFRDNITKAHLPSATVDLVGTGLLNETNNQYNITIKAIDLGQGITVLTIFAQLTNYQSQSIQFFVEMIERATELELLIEGNPTNDGETIQLELDEKLNITVNFRDNITKVHLSNATVDLVGRGLLNETNNQYNITVRAVDLGQGITILTIFAQLSNYQPQSIQIFIEVIERNTELQLFIENFPRNDGDTIQLEIDDSINITISFKDNITKALLSNATVNLIGRGQLNETNNQYNITINAQDLNQGITVLTIFAQLDNYQAQSIQFFIEVVERFTSLQLFLNDEETTDPVITTTIGSILNITVRFTDNKTGLHISNATLQLIGESLTLNLTEDIAFGQHYLIFDTTEIGVKFFTIVAQATNYQIQTINPRITVERITAEIYQVNGTSQIIIELGKVVTLYLKLNDTSLSTLIKGANITYFWLYGNGKLEDLDNDGTYEATLPNVFPAGTFTITITALAGYNYTFEQFKITLIVSEPTVSPAVDLSWLVFVLIGAIVGLVSIFFVYQSYFKYPPLVRKIRKLRKNIGKGKKSKKPIEILKREKLIENELKAQTELIKAESIPVDDKSKDIKKKKKKNSE
ncbi:hypothetical protein LCGC14_1144090 [marine sediment metagenome]|uniref:PKD domain-containing protein n=1 Tax=marine sediment metagenome TaxID=412755 RepID=A0A0F9LXI2_9ZZZZ